MSDFIYSKSRLKKGMLAKELEKIYQADTPTIKEFHGNWGSLAVSTNTYNGFQPYETHKHIAVVIGGPILCFEENDYFKHPFSSAGTKFIFRRWLKGDIRWDEDLSGPYTLLFVNKETSEVLCITDLMSFIPVYTYNKTKEFLISTHIDVLASVSNQKEIDIVSQVDFILNGVTTFPYTYYNNLFQLEPASEHRIDNLAQVHSKSYWIPREEFLFKSIDQAAEQIRNSLKGYVREAVKNMPSIAQFISAGEDSRVVSALLSNRTNRDAFIFLDYMNREGKLAKKAADAYGANFNIVTRSKFHYLEILPASVNLIGNGIQYTHSHSFGLHKKSNLNKYTAVFGGLLSDGLLKGARIKKIRVSGRLPFLPQIKNSNYSAGDLLINNAFKDEVLEEVNRRRKEHLNYIKEIRRESAEEWFELWPISMNMNIANYHTNRRLFSSYEPFMSKDIVKISAVIPQKWKLNRKVFHKAVKPLLKPTKWMFHGNGKLPYFSWQINNVLYFITWITSRISRKIGLVKGNQGSWVELNQIINSSKWNKMMEKYVEGGKVIEPALKDKEVEGAFQHLNAVQQINLMQVLYSNYKNNLIKH